MTTTPTAIAAEEAADRLAIRELVDAYAHFADRRQPDQQAALYADDGRTMIVPYIRYQDSFVKHDGAWRFAERRLIIDWSDSRPSQPIRSPEGGDD